MKIKLLSAAILTTMGITALGTVVNAAEYPDATNGISDVNVSVEIGEDGGPTIPPIDPENPVPPIDPDEGNPNNGPLALRYVSNLVFPSLPVSTERTAVHANQDSNDDGELFDNMVTIQDFRNDTTRDGWELTVKQDTNATFIPGSFITMTPYVHPTIAAQYAIQTPSASGLQLNSAEQVFASTENQENPAGIVSIGFANPDTDGVELSVPANTPVGDYKTTLTWNLASAPLEDD